MPKRFPRPRFSALALAALVAGCAAARPLPADLVTGYGPRPDRFQVCHGYGCRLSDHVRLSAADWISVRAAFAPPAADAAAERRRIAAAVALLERLSAPWAGTGDDGAEAHFLSGGPGQMDCVDETLNTTTYLVMMADDGLLRWHRPGRPARRGRLVDGTWPHNTAVIEERATGRAWAVDAYFHANGQPPDIVPLDRWLAGWRPRGS
ncbi:MAG: hypothetical protein H6907_07300 [Hyphomicrobiales bacterium]|nr:hypothetical protein [Hyphomicrobiales bacterium]MCP5371529.1 hypothetical protein [Hyphomicrobiales bacterium]